MFINILAMILFGIAIGVLICFVGGLMAVDLVPRQASGAALGIIGIASYVGAGIQDIISGALLDKHKNRRRRHHDTRLQRRIGILDRRIGSVVPAGRGRLAQGGEKQPAENGELPEITRIAVPHNPGSQAE